MDVCTIYPHVSAAALTLHPTPTPTPTVRSLGTVLEELFAGFLLEPVCTLGRQGLLHLRHVLLRLQWETDRKQVKAGVRLPNVLRHARTEE